MQREAGGEAIIPQMTPREAIIPHIIPRICIIKFKCAPKAPKVSVSKALLGRVIERQTQT